MFAATRGRGAATASLRGEHQPEWFQRQIPASPEAARTSPRGRYRGRYRATGGGYSGDWRASRTPQLPSKNFHDGLDPEPIKTFKLPLPQNVVEVVVKDVKYHTSYSWLDTPQPTIVVPGSPRIWCEKPLPFTVSPDAGITIAYANAQGAPDSPLLPLFRAIDALKDEPAHEDIDWTQVDFVTDRNNFRKLLGWIAPTAMVAEEFRIDLQLCGVGTVLMQRWERRETYNAVGFGDSFERESTKPGPDCEKAPLAAHHRIISYNFHGMRIMLRCEVDACFIPENVSEASADIEGSKSSTLDDLADALASLKVSSGAGPASAVAPSPHDIKVVRGGVEVPQSSLIKIKTRSARNVETFDWTAAYIQLFLGQTPNLYTGVHRSGNFYEVQKKSMESPELTAAAKSAQEALKKLRRLLDEIHYVVMHHDFEGRLSLVCQGGELKMYTRKSQESFLPQEILDRF